MPEPYQYNYKTHNSSLKKDLGPHAIAILDPYAPPLCELLSMQIPALCPVLWHDELIKRQLLENAPPYHNQRMNHTEISYTFEAGETSYAAGISIE